MGVYYWKNVRLEFQDWITCLWITCSWGSDVWKLIRKLHPLTPTATRQNFWWSQLQNCVSFQMYCCSSILHGLLVLNNSPGLQLSFEGSGLLDPIHSADHVHQSGLRFKTANNRLQHCRDAKMASPEPQDVQATTCCFCQNGVCPFPFNSHMEISHGNAEHWVTAFINTSMVDSEKLLSICSGLLVPRARQSREQ